MKPKIDPGSWRLMCCGQLKRDGHDPECTVGMIYGKSVDRRFGEPPPDLGGDPYIYERQQRRGKI